MDNQQKETLTLKQMCEHIVKGNIFLTPMTAEQVFNYSPTGELFMIPYWYKIACFMLRENASGYKYTNTELWNLFKPQKEEDGSKSNDRVNPEV